MGRITRVESELLAQALADALYTFVGKTVSFRVVLNPGEPGGFEVQSVGSPPGEQLDLVRAFAAGYLAKAAAG